MSGTKELKGIKCLDTKPREVCDRVSRMPNKKFVNKLLGKAQGFSDNNNPVVSFKRRCFPTPVCVQGWIMFNNAERKPEAVKFSTIVILEPKEPGAFLPPSFEYDAFLKAGKVGYTLRKGISQEIKPGESDNFLIRVTSDKSASFHFVMNIMDAGGNVAWSGDFNMGILVPYSGAKSALRGIGDETP